MNPSTVWLRLIQRLRLGLAAGVALLAAAFGTPAWAESLQPYVLGSRGATPFAEAAETARNRLKEVGFEIVGEYTPYPGALVIAVSSPALREAAAKDRFGGFAAAWHVGITQVGGEVQTSYLNPGYLAAAYRITADLGPIAAQLRDALGAELLHGTAKGRTAAELASYRYMMGMERFDDFYRLGRHKDHATAVATVERRLKEGVGGAGFVYRVDIPGKEQVLFGVSRANVKDRNANDKHIMADTVEQAFEIKTTPYLPYQMLVDGNEVIAHHMRFRMAVWHPDLTMMTFGKLMASPGAIERLLRDVAGGQRDFEF